MKRRPTADDRDIADYLRKMKPGEWRVTVEDLMAAEGFGLVPFKPQGGMLLNTAANTRITFIPPMETRG